MKEYIIIYWNKETEELESVEKGEGTNVIDFLKQANELVLKHFDWIVYEIDGETSKEELIRSGELDEVLPE